MFYDPVKQKGFINSRLKTVQKNVRETTGERKQTKKRSSSNSSVLNVSSILENVDIEALKLQFKDDIEFLSNCPSSETSAIIERMRRTFPLRKAIISSPQKSILWNIFPCYLTTPDIVSFSCKF